MTIATFRPLVSAERQMFALQCILQDGRNVVIDFPIEGAVYLKTVLEKAFEDHPEMRNWRSVALS
jgi:hypothetical protein